MTDLTTDDSLLESGVGTALREYADGIHPDLDSLVTTSRTAGTRIRRRRQLGVTVGIAAATASIIGLASVGGLLSNGSRNAQEAPGFAGQPTSATHANACGKTLRGSLPQFIKSVRRAPAGPNADLRKLSGKIRQQGNGPAVCTSKPLASLKTLGGSGQAPPSVYGGQDVTIHLAGWKQVGGVGDDKQSLEGPHGAVADIVWRSASEYQTWISSSDKGNTSSVWTSRVHHGVFVSIQGGAGTTDADIQALGASLTWN